MHREGHLDEERRKFFRGDERQGRGVIVPRDRVYESIRRRTGPGFAHHTGRSWGLRRMLGAVAVRVGKGCKER